jgi:hypothetical protein
MEWAAGPAGSRVEKGPAQPVSAATATAAMKPCQSQDVTLALENIDCPSEQGSAMMLLSILGMNWGFRLNADETAILPMFRAAR